MGIRLVFPVIMPKGQAIEKRPTSLPIGQQF